MPDFNQPTRSKWGFNVPSKRMIEFQVKQANRQALLQEAASLLPDQGKLTEMLMKNEMHPANMAEVKGKLDAITQIYQENYNQNPYYSFSREAKNLARAMHAVVNDPSLQSMTQQYEFDKDNWKKARVDGIVDNIDVNDEGILAKIAVKDEQGNVVDYKIGRKRRLDKEDAPMTLNQHFQDITNRQGARAGGFNYKMSTNDQVLNNLDKAFSRLGDTKVEQDIIQQGRKVASSSNRTQLVSRTNWLLNQGVTQDDLNNLYSQYFKKSGNYDMDNARRYAIKYIADYAAGIEENMRASEYFPEYRKALLGLDDDGRSTKTVELPIPYASINDPSNRGSIRFEENGVTEANVIKNGGTYAELEGPVVQGIFDEAKKKSFQSEGRQVNDFRLSEMPILSRQASRGIYVPSHNGGMMKLNGNASEIVISDDPKDKLVLVTLPVDQNGQPASITDQRRIAEARSRNKQIPQDLVNKYFRPRTDNDVKAGIATTEQPYVLRQAHFQRAVGLIPEKGEFKEQLGEDGYSTYDDAEVQRMYNNNSGNQIDRIGTNWIDNNDVYRVNLFLPANTLQDYMLDKVHGEKEGITQGPYSQMRDPSQGMDPQYFGISGYGFNQTSHQGFKHY